MVLGDNRGHSYEKKIVKIMGRRGIIDVGSRGAGSGPGTDIQFTHRGKKYKLEIKNNLTSPDYGQKRLIPVLRGKKWSWKWSNDEDITRYYTKIGVLDYLNAKNITPFKHRKPDSEITVSDKRADQRAFEDRTYEISVNAFYRFYKGKADYLQVGRGSGFYHLGDDVAKLGTERFDGEFILRFRAKAHHTVPVSNYSFFAVLKCTSTRRRSRFNIEDSAGQVFPPIVP